MNVVDGDGQSSRRCVSQTDEGVRPTKDDPVVTQPVLMCARCPGHRVEVHALRGVRQWSAAGVVTGHETGSTALCGKEVSVRMPFQPPQKVLLLDETVECPECLDLIVAREAAESRQRYLKALNQTAAVR